MYDKANFVWFYEVYFCIVHGLSGIIYFVLVVHGLAKKHALRYEPSGDHLYSAGWLYNMRLFQLFTGFRRGKCFVYDL